MNVLLLGLEVKRQNKDLEGQKLVLKKAPLLLEGIDKSFRKIRGACSTPHGMGLDHVIVSRRVRFFRFFAGH